MILIGLCWLCGSELWRLHGRTDIDTLKFLLAMLTFFMASAGSAMLCVGAHLLDEVEVSQRWACRSLPDRFPEQDAGKKTRAGLADCMNMSAVTTLPSSDQRAISP
jgi:hypothetical protein